MKKLSYLLGLAGAIFLPTFPVTSAHFATTVIAYHPGTGVNAIFTDPIAALGEPSRITSGEWGGPVDPFNPPYLSEQLVSIGAGGWLTLGFSTPIHNHPANPFGMDFIVFGNAGFIITNGDFTGGGITDGSLFGASEGTARLSVSHNNVDWFQLDPLLTPPVDRYFPTDGSGDFTLPVDPSLNAGSFEGLGLSGIRSLYAGSGGGTAFDIGWAIDANGAPMHLPSVQFIRIDVLSGTSEIDAVVAIPEPGTWALLLCGGTALGVARFRKRQPRFKSRP